MQMWLIYEAATGRIAGRCGGDNPQDQCEPGYSYIEEIAPANSAAQYVSNGAIADRPANSSALDTSSIPADEMTPATITGVPNPTNARIIGPMSGDMVITGGRLEIVAGIPGEYRVILDSFPYLEVEFAIHAI